jgi:hypothetical protein
MPEHIPNQPVTLADVNILNRIFWRKQSELLDRRMQDPDLRQTAMDDLKSEEAMMVPVKNRKSLEQALYKAEKSRNIFLRTFSRKGGRAAKTDGLRGVILEIVRAEPDIKTRQLQHKLRNLAQEGHSVVFKVDRKSDLLVDQAEQIHFRDNGRETTSPVSGLKDRLFRAKNEILSR